MRSFALIVLMACSYFIAFGQEAPTDPSPHLPERATSKKPGNSFSWDKVSLGGNLGISRYAINVAPVAGYMITEKVMAGIGINYISLGSPYYAGRITIYGGKVFGRYFIKEFAFLHAEVEELNGPWDPFYQGNMWINTTLLGAGYRQSLGGTVFMDMMVLWNINDHVYSPYTNPVLRMGFNIGL